MSDRYYEGVTFSNPRLKAVIEDWPSGKQRVTCTFEVEAKKGKGERVNRITTGKPKSTTYTDWMCIVDGDDGKTYLLGADRGAGDYSVVTIWPGTLQNGVEYVYKRGQEERYLGLIALVNQAHEA